MNSILYRISIVKHEEGCGNQTIHFGFVHLGAGVCEFCDLQSVQYKIRSEAWIRKYYPEHVPTMFSCFRYFQRRRALYHPPTEQGVACI